MPVATGPHVRGHEAGGHEAHAERGWQQEARIGLPLGSNRRTGPFAGGVAEQLHPVNRRERCCVDASEGGGRPDAVGSGDLGSVHGPRVEHDVLAALERLGTEGAVE